MCELFGLDCVNKIDITALLKEFFSHGNEHPHGWGLALFYETSVSLEKEPENSVKSRYLRYRLESSITADKAMAHIRLATRGSMRYDNSHPFVMRDNFGRAWTFEHNGTIFEADVLEKYSALQRGSTDSERILMYIIDCVNEAQDRAKRQLFANERFELIDKIICTLAPENKLNLLIYDGELLYAHTNLEGSLNVLEEPDAAVISTRPLDKRPWKELPLNTLVAYKDGKRAYTGTDHGCTFDEEKMKLLFINGPFIPYI